MLNKESRMSARMISIAVVTSGDAQTLPGSFVKQAKSVGQLVAELGCNLITGGGQGGMTSVAQGFCETPNRVGRSIGIIPGRVDWGQSARLGEIGHLQLSPKNGYPNPWIEIPIFTHLSGADPKGDTSRNIINVASADIVIALKGGQGTQAEFELALSIPHKPVFVFLVEGEKVGQYDSKVLSETHERVVTEFNELRTLLEKALIPFSLARPAYSALSGVYKTNPSSVHRCSLEFPNTCAIRMSEALAQVVPDIKLKFAASGKTLCPHQYMRGAQDLAGVLRQADIFGIYNAGFTAPGEAPNAIKGVKGIVAYMNIPTYPDGQGHIDLWDGENPVGSAYWAADPIWFWKLN